jgi:hypothetical protein
VAPRPLRSRLGFTVATRLATRVLGVGITREGGVALARPIPGASSELEGDRACTFYGSALAELLRLLTDFDGAMVHVACRARGDTECQWRSARPYP